MTLVVGGLTIMAYTGSYLSVERIAIAIGAFELVFLMVAWKAQPDLGAGRPARSASPGTSRNTCIWSPPISAR